VTSADDPVFDYDVALSFAGEDRTYVGNLAARLRELEVRVFYDEYAAAEMWGSDLYVLLDDVYRKRARFTVMFVSQHYASKPWTQHERQSAQARTLIDPGPWLLPVRLDDTELPGLRPQVGYVDARTTSLEELVSLIQQKLLITPGLTSGERPLLRCPRTVDQKRELLAQRPDGWEYLLYAGAMWLGRQALESKWLDHELGYARRSGPYIDDREAIRLVSKIMTDFGVSTDNVVRMLNPQGRERAFGLLGQPGDPALIEHIADRFIEVYEEILDTAARLRGARVSRNMESVMDCAARMADSPLKQIRDFVDQLVAETDMIPERLARDEDVTINLALILTIEDETKMRVKREMERAAAAMKPRR
jgi:hypothetical protein